MVADGYAVLLGHIKRIYENTNGLAWSEPVAVYAKPTNNAPQRKYVQLSDNSEEFKTFVYVSQPQVQRLTPLRRATEAYSGAAISRCFSQARLP
ncbi:hypothetical protein JG687_00013325 [Phytophthora cactorum]|uniref:Uncharacterized protein n=1 Tax=Phytophthora cactorum TaxID=29920 RepID=A0A8T1U1R8_9STRA|nr:hypothetical protein JG687_00013325 [Phytophthora cactorum]